MVFQKKSAESCKSSIVDIPRYPGFYQTPTELGDTMPKKKSFYFSEYSRRLYYPFKRYADDLLDIFRIKSETPFDFFQILRFL